LFELESKALDNPLTLLDNWSEVFDLVLFHAGFDYS